MYFNFDPCTASEPYIKAIGGMSGLGCAECHGKCGMAGFSMDGSGLFGTGVFGDSVTVTDISTWTWAEYLAILFGVYAVTSVVSDAKRAGRKVKRVTRKRSTKRSVVAA